MHYYLKYLTPDSNILISCSPYILIATLSPRLSECAILPKHLPSGLVIPSIAMYEPLIFHSSSIDTLPSRSQYCVATCPLAKSLSSHSLGATNLPSPCEAGLQYTPPSSALASHGLKLLTTLVYTILDI